MEGDFNNRDLIGFESRDAVEVLMRLRKSLLALQWLGVCHHDINQANILYKERDNHFVFTVSDYEAVELANTAYKTETKWPASKSVCHAGLGGARRQEAEGQAGFGPPGGCVLGRPLAVSLVELFFVRLSFDADIS